MGKWAAGNRAQLTGYPHFTSRSMIVCEIADPLLMVLDAMQSAAVISRPHLLHALCPLRVVAVCKSADLLLMMFDSR